MPIIGCPTCKSKSMVLTGEIEGIRRYECLKCGQKFYPTRLTAADFARIQERAAQAQQEEACYLERIEEKLNPEKPKFRIYIP